MASKPVRLPIFIRTRATPTAKRTADRDNMPIFDVTLSFFSFDPALSPSASPSPSPVVSSAASSTASLPALAQDGTSPTTIAHAESPVNLLDTLCEYIEVRLHDSFPKPVQKLYPPFTMLEEAWGSSQFNYTVFFKDNFHPQFRGAIETLSIEKQESEVKRVMTFRKLQPDVQRKYFTPASPPPALALLPSTPVDTAAPGSKSSSESAVEPQTGLGMTSVIDAGSRKRATPDHRDAENGDHVHDDDAAARKRPAVATEQSSDLKRLQSMLSQLSGMHVLKLARIVYAAVADHAEPPLRVDESARRFVIDLKSLPSAVVASLEEFCQSAANSTVAV
ncbi:hypothetical protein RI367_007892 [Sorochytrium milnesiophthora]